MGKSNKTPTEPVSELGRRNFIYIATGAVAAVGAGAAAWPMIAHMNPAADRSHLRHATVDITKIPEGSELLFLVHNRPVFVRHRTEAEIADAQNVDLSKLLDPETDDQRLVPMKNGALNRKFLVVLGICPFFGCVLKSDQDQTMAQGKYGGWYCNCHGSDFDTSGRVRRGPSTQNMMIPTYRYVSESMLEILYYPNFQPTL